MAVIEKIRNRAGILIAVVIGIALFAFIANDFLSSGRIGRGKNVDNIAIIKGKEIKYRDFSERYQYLENLQIAQDPNANNLSTEMQMQIRNRVWAEIVEERLLLSEIKKLGMEVHNKEMMYIINGPSPHPYIKQRFTDQNGEFRRDELTNTLNVLRQEKDTPRKLEWIEIEELLYRDRLKQKYITLLAKSNYVTDLEAKRNYMNTLVRADVEYVEKRFNDISDSSITVKESDLKEYYKKHKKEYKQDESVDLTYVAFEVFPSDEDYQDAKQWVADQLEDFKNKKYSYRNDIGDIYEEGELPSELDSFMFNSEIGSVKGPYLEDLYYKAAVLDTIYYMPDSVRVSHLLFPNPRTQEEQTYLIALADSVFKLANEGYSFELLVAENSADQATKNEGGDLGWINSSMYGPLFDDSCYFAKPGEVKKTLSQYGLHLVKVTAQSPKVKKVQVRTVEHLVRPSDNTDKVYYDMASKFAFDNKSVDKFNASIKKGGVVSNTKYNLSPMTPFVDDIESSRKLVRWAFSVEEGEMSHVERYGNKYIIAIVEKVRKKGTIPFEDIKEDITAQVKKELKGKALIKEMEEAKKESSTIEQIASKLKAEVQSTEGVMFATPAIKLADIAGVSYMLDENTISAPVLGENGVYIVKVNSKSIPETEDVEYEMIKRTMVEEQINSLNTHFSNKLSEEGDEIKDFRVNFY